MEGIGDVGERGKEKSCMSRNLPGLLALGIIDSGDV
jgi:hypothetical protein